MGLFDQMRMNDCECPVVGCNFIFKKSQLQPIDAAMKRRLQRFKMSQSNTQTQSNRRGTKSQRPLRIDDSDDDD
jgi:hypothetical protein